MSGIINRMANYIVQRSGREEVYEEVISYGLQAVLGTLAEIAAVLLTGALLGIFKEILVVSSVFAAMRIVSGGVHFSTYIRCFVSSIVMFTLGGYAAYFLKGLSLITGQVYIATGSLYVLYCLCRYSPRDNPNRLIKENEWPKFRRMSFIVAGLIFMVLILTYIFRGKMQWYHYSLVTGLILEGFSLTDTGYKFVLYIESKLNRGGGVNNEKS